MQFGSVRLLLLFIAYPSFFCQVSDSVDLKWCMYKFYTDPKSWSEAKAICEQANLTLAHIRNTNEFDFIWSVIPTQLSAMYTDFPSTVWLGGYKGKGEKPKWQDDCMEIDQSEYKGRENGEEEACIKLLKGNKNYTAAGCDDQIPFLCQDSTTDINRCYTSTAAVTGLTVTGPSNSKSGPTECFSLCTSSDCHGIQYRDGQCRMLTMSGSTTYTKGALYVKDILRTAPPGVTPSISPTQSTPDIIMTSLPCSDTATPHSGSPAADSTLISSPTGQLYPSSTATEQEGATSTTPSLSNDVTSVNLDKTSLPTVSKTTEPISVSCTTCPCTKPTQLNQEELEERIAQLRKELIVDKKTLSSWKRTKSSAPDDRQSAANIGYVGVLIICLVPLVIILMDIGRLNLSLKQFRSRVKKPVADEEI